jgi:SAM-dependent methyltransferase
MKSQDILEANANNYETLYAKDEAFLRYPADWIIRFHNMFLKHNIPANARVLDYGCGSANNAVFFTQKGYTVSGVDVAPSFKKLVEKNFELHNIDKANLDNYKLIDPDSTSLPFEDNTFDFVFSNQVLYYLPNEEHLKAVNNELKRVLKPNGYVFFTMMGPKNYYITHHLKEVHGDRVFEIRIDEPEHRLNGVRELILIVRDEKDLCELFDAFEPVSTGYFDQKMFDMNSNFHFIYVGKNTK